MKLSDFASVSGRGGLYRVVKPGKSGMLLESVDETKSKFVAGAHSKVSLLDEISIFTRTKEGTIPLGQVMGKIKKDFDNDLGIDSNADASELKAFMKSVVPDYDETRVYTSDIKKLVRWYGILRQFAPEVLSESAPVTGAKD